MISGYVYYCDGKMYDVEIQSDGNIAFKERTHEPTPISLDDLKKLTEILQRPNTSDKENKNNVI